MPLTRIGRRLRGACRAARVVGVVTVVMAVAVIGMGGVPASAQLQIDGPGFGLVAGGAAKTGGGTDDEGGAAAAVRLPGEVRGAAVGGRGSSSARVATWAVLSTGSDAVVPGSDIVVAVVFDMDEHWHLHTHHPQVPPELGDASFYIATNVTAEVAGGTQGTRDAHATEATPGTSATPGVRATPGTRATAEAEAGAAPPLVVYSGFMQWPEPVEIEVAFTGTPVMYGVYSGRAVVYLPVTVSPDAAPGDAELVLKLTYQSCDDKTCLAPVIDQTLRLMVPVRSRASADAGESSMTEAQRAALHELFAGFDTSVWASINAGVAPPAEPVSFGLFGWEFEVDPNGVAGFALFLVVAAVGGFLLNLTPCVLPVIPIKIMGLAQSAGSRGRTLLLGVFMAAGVVAFWLSIGGALAFVSGFSAVNELFQRSGFTLGVGVFIAVMAVGMCGLFTVRLPRWVYFVNPKQESPLGAVLFGVLTAVLSTPCTAPFMGSAAASATKMGPASTLATFAAIGGGMALPYLVLAAFPKLVDRMPRTGPASELIKQVMGLLMLAAAAFFIGVGVSAMTQNPPAPPSLGYWWVVAAIVAVATVWGVVGVWRISDCPKRRAGWTVAGLAVLVMVALGAKRLTDQGPIPWVYYTPQAFADALADDRVVVMDFTAEWCLNCKALEQSVLHNARVVALAGSSGGGGGGGAGGGSGGVTFMKVDITSESNVAGKAMLEAVGRVTIPALVVFAPDGEQTLNRDFYTVEQVLAAVRAARRETPSPAAP